VRLLDAFTFNKELGTLYIVLKRILIDVMEWIVLFLIIAIGFQISFMALTQQVDDISVWTPTMDSGTFMGSYYTIIGDWDTTMTILRASWFGVVLVSLYALIAQIMLVNLLIAMMGDTFENVRQNAITEWRFWRYNTILVYKNSSEYPPPLNIFLNPIVWLCNKVCTRKNSVPRQETKEEKDQKTEDYRKIVKEAQDAFLEEYV